MMAEGLKDQLKKPHIQVAVLFSTLALALISNALFGARGNPLNFLPVLFGIIVALEIIYFVAAEVKDGAKKHGWKHEIVDTLIALAVAAGIWFGLSFLLSTSTPVSAVVSCSMLPNLQRGDFVIVQGAPVNAYQIEMSGAELDSLNDPAIVSSGSSNVTIDGSLFSYCLAKRNASLCSAFSSSPEIFLEKKGPFTYRYERCPIGFQDGTSGTMPCVKSVTFKGKEYLTNFSNDVIIFGPVAGDVYSQIGDIVHRVMFRIEADGKTYYLTRGDNNPLLDIQVYDYRFGLANRPVPQENVRGKVIGRIPLLGYFKLFIQGYFQEDTQCRTQLEFTHIQ
jgi:signal peptidase I